MRTNGLVESHRLLELLLLLRSATRYMRAVSQGMVMGRSTDHKLGIAPEALAWPTLVTDRTHVFVSCLFLSITHALFQSL